jgi:hypothetical protein
MFILCFLTIAGSAVAQPFGAWLVKGSSQGYVAVPANSAFDFTNGFTFEAWTTGSDPGGCSSLAGEDYTRAFWIGVCGTTLRSYLRGTSSLFDGGKVPTGWTHIAVTWDGTTHRHYINGELVASRVETGPMTTSSAELRIFGDVSYQITYNGAIDEVRFWNVARTRDEIRSTITSIITTAQPGLVAVYHLDGNAVDSIGGHNGTTLNGAAYLNAPVTLSCGSSSSSQLCLAGSRYAVTANWLTDTGATGAGSVVPGSSSNSGLFTFFAADNWELLVKVLDGCGINNRMWVFSAATTNVHYELIVTDVRSGETKRYINYLGVNAPAVNDTSAFASCP